MVTKFESYGLDKTCLNFLLDYLIFPEQQMKFSSS